MKNINTTVKLSVSKGYVETEDRNRSLLSTFRAYRDASPEKR